MDVADGRSAVGWLCEVEVRPVRGVDERRRWDALMREHHYLPFRGLFGKSLRHVAVRGARHMGHDIWDIHKFMPVSAGDLRPIIEALRTVDAPDYHGAVSNQITEIFAPLRDTQSEHFASTR